MIINILSFFLLLGVPFSISNPADRVKEDRIIGKWMSIEKNVVVDVYKDGDEFKAKVVWFDDTDDLNRPMNKRCDIHNPKKELRHRKLIGLDVVKNLKYNEDTNRWEDGVIYDPNTGKEWNSVVYFNDEGLMEVKGYWHLEFLSKTMAFEKAD